MNLEKTTQFSQMKPPGTVRAINLSRTSQQNKQKSSSHNEDNRLEIVSIKPGRHIFKSSFRTSKRGHLGQCVPANDQPPGHEVKGHPGHLERCRRDGRAGLGSWQHRNWRQQPGINYRRAPARGHSRGNSRGKRTDNRHTKFLTHLSYVFIDGFIIVIDNL